MADIIKIMRSWCARHLRIVQILWVILTILCMAITAWWSVFIVWVLWAMFMIWLQWDYYITIVEYGAMWMRYYFPRGKGK